MKSLPTWKEAYFPRIWKKDVSFPVFSETAAYLEVHIEKVDAKVQSLQDADLV